MGLAIIMEIRLGSAVTNGNNTLTNTHTTSIYHNLLQTFRNKTSLWIFSIFDYQFDIIWWLAKTEALKYMWDDL